MRDISALDNEGNEVPNYIGYETGGIYRCRHPGCHALVRFHKGPASHEIFAYALPGQVHDHSLEGDRTVLAPRKPISSLVEKILAGVQNGGNISKAKTITKKKTGPDKKEKSDYIIKFRNIASLQEMYRSDLCERKGSCYIRVNGETIGDFFTSFVDRHYLFESLFGQGKKNTSILTGGHIIELIPSRCYSTTLDAYLSDTVTINGAEFKAYINVHLTFQSSALLSRVKKLCIPSESSAAHMFLVCCDFKQTQPVSLGSGNALRIRYSGSVCSEQQICISPVPYILST